MSDPTKIAIVHDWLVGMRGGEKVLEVLCELYPGATLFTLVHRKGRLSPAIEGMKIVTSFLQDMPLGKMHYRHYLPLFPLAMRQLDLSDFDLVISSSHAAAKAARAPEGSVHICYCHTPMRYIWDQYDQYFGRDRASLPTRIGAALFRNYLRNWDVATAEGVDYFIANSENVRKRIQRIYGRDSDVIYPPVDTARFASTAANHEYYLMVSALVNYKRVDTAIEAFNRLGLPLRIVGTGEQLKYLKTIAKSNVTFLGWKSDDDLPALFGNCKALVFPGEEDFGIVPVEAMASGRPVIAFGEGGLLETVVEGKTGIFFHEQTAESLAAAVKRMETMKFDETTIRDHALQFDRSVFKKKISDYVEQKWRLRAVESR
jgi:glycosyltransferase involved in cell wall biosynthesis